MFAWDEKRPKDPKSAKRAVEARLAMYRRELEDRAGLLHRLGYSQKRAKARLLAGVQWDFELHGSPKHAGDVDKIVDGVYRRGSGA